MKHFKWTKFDAQFDDISFKQKIEDIKIDPQCVKFKKIKNERSIIIETICKVCDGIVKLPAFKCSKC